MATSAEAMPLERRYSGLLRWITTTDHKDIGILYIFTGMFFFLVGGLEALLIRIQLAQPGMKFLSPDVYNQMFTMHGTTMIFLFGMPVLIGLANYMVPLMIGARDMAFPRLNAFSFWVFVFGGIVFYSGFILGGAADAGWFAYAPLSTSPLFTSNGMDLWAMGIILTGVGSIIGAVNLIVTILNLRAPGMTMFRVPVFVWQVLVTAFLLLFAIPSLTVNAVLLFLERRFGAPFFAALQGGEPLLWQNLFWFFGHPEVYILILPAFGIVSEVIPVFSKKPIFGYRALIISGIAIGFLGFTVWAHHMFSVGMTPASDASFSLASMIIAVPTSIKIFNWIATMWGGRVQLNTPMLFMIGFIAMFIIGGLSGVSVAVVPFDQQVTDTYYIVAHLHYVLFGGTVLAVFGGIFYWFPKWSGRMLSDKLGKVQFWILLVGFNLTFLPMHWLGMVGMTRRIYTYQNNPGWAATNLAETIGAFIIFVGMLVFLYNVFKSLRSGEIAPADPWDGATLEWATSSPPPPYDFAEIPTVHSLRPVWDAKHPDAPIEGQTPPPQVPMVQKITGDESGSRQATAQHPELEQAVKSKNVVVHMPGGSFNPILISFGLFIAAYAAIYALALVPVGLVIALAGIILWAWETP